MLAQSSLGFADETVTVRNGQEFRAAMGKATAGTTILLASGDYGGGFGFENVKGEAGRPVAIGAADPQNPPVFRNSGAAIHFVDPAYLELRDLVIENMSGNGINIDDGGSYGTPAHHVTIRNLRVRDIGPGGNHDGLKLSGVDDFRIEGCTIERWGTAGGSGIDMVGCHRGTIANNTFRHTGPHGCSGVQAKGGSRDIRIVRNRFEDAGDRAVNAGGSTGFSYFRPPLASRENGARNFEARGIEVAANTFIGGGTPAAFVGQEGSTVSYNTVYRPKRFALRILQETRAPDFAPSQNGLYRNNIIVFRSDEMRTAVNIGPDTNPESFRFEGNFWYCLDDPKRSRPSLPAPEKAGVYGIDPQLRDPERGDLRLRPGSPATKAGPDAPGASQ
jgi:hypothetical protein